MKIIKYLDFFIHRRIRFPSLSIYWQHIRINGKSLERKKKVSFSSVVTRVCSYKCNSLLRYARVTQPFDFKRKSSTASAWPAVSSGRFERARRLMAVSECPSGHPPDGGASAPIAQDRPRRHTPLRRHWRLQALRFRSSNAEARRCLSRLRSARCFLSRWPLF